MSNSLKSYRKLILCRAVGRSENTRGGGASTNPAIGRSENLGKGQVLIQCSVVDILAKSGGGDCTPDSDGPA